jgi:hypothetical protein
MKESKFKELVKTAVREAIQEELKDILLEAVKSPTVVQNPLPVMETLTPEQEMMKAQDRRAAYANILGDMASPMTTNNVQPQFNPQGGFDSANGTLPQGEVGMDQIMGLMKQ